MSDDFELFERRDSHNKKFKHEEDEDYENQGDNNHKEKHEFSHKSIKDLTKNKWLLIGLIIGGLILIALVIMIIIFILPYVLNTIKATNIGEIINSTSKTINVNDIVKTVTG